MTSTNNPDGNTGAIIEYRPAPLVPTDHIPHSVRHARALVRRQTISQKASERKKAQRRSQVLLKKAIIKPTAGHISPRPNRHANKREKVKRFIHDAAKTPNTTKA